MIVLLVASGSLLGINKFGGELMLNKIMDMHNHTTWSDGLHRAEVIIENAINNGVGIIGISDHFNTIKCNSVPDFMLKQYIESLKEIKDKYKDKIEVLVGIEICMSKGWCQFDRLPYDTLNMLDYVLFEYVDFFSDSVTLQEINEYTGKVTCKKGLAHTNLFNLGKKYGLENVMKVLKDNDLFWEINVNPGYEYFDKIIENKDNIDVVELFNKLKEYEIKITVGSDTHSLRYYDIKRIRIGNQLAHYDLANK